MSIICGLSLSAQQLAFPEAEGFGKYAIGGRSGSVYHVTNLNDSGAGSFRDAVSQSNRIVVFDVAGIITLKSVCVVKKNITIAGQTAPGDGITITGQRVAFNSDSGNDIVRYIRVRLPRSAGSGVDAMSISDNADNLIFDHVSVSWGADGTFDINSTDAENITIQDCIIGQGADWHGHSTGGLIQSGPISIIRSLWIDNVTRNPKIRFQHEIINSVIYNWAERGLIMGDTDNADSHCNLIGNYFIAGPSTTSTGSYVSGTTSRYHVYESDNWLDIDKDGTLDGTLLVGANGDYKTATVVETPYNYPGVNTILTAQNAVAHLIDNVGPSIARDAVDELLITQLSSNGTLGAIVQDETSNGISNGGLGTVFNGPKPQDTDGDGMPDEWEDANGTDKNVNDAMVISGNGYANIENYINSIDGPIIEFLRYPTSISASAKTETTITLSWTNNDDADQIYIEYGTSASSFTKSVYVTGDQVTATIPNLSSGTTYFFRLQAKSSSAESAYSDVVSAKTQDAAIPPVACSNPSPANGSTLSFINGVVLTWNNTTNAMGGALSYDVYFGTASDQMQLVSENQTSKSYSAGDLNDLQTYYWRVKATNDLGSHDGITWSFTTESGADKILYIPFDETSGTVAANLNGTNNANATNFTPTWTTGKLNNCAYFSASPTSSSFLVNHYSDLYLNTSPFTISLWFKSPGTVADSYLFHKGTHSATGGTGKWIGIQYKASTLYFGVDDNSTKTIATLAGSQWFNNQWHHIACVRDIAADKLRIYIDGVKKVEVTDNTGGIGESAALNIGNRNQEFDNPYIGSLDELIMFNSALTSDEIEYIYNSTATKVLGTSIHTKELSAYPNPFENKLTIDNPEENSLVILQLVSLNGSLVYSKTLEAGTSQITIEGISDLPKGLYTCRIIGNTSQYIQKVLKK